MPHCNLIGVRCDECTTFLAQLPELASIADHLHGRFVEDLGSLIDRQAGHFGIEEDDEQPADKADRSVESECPGRS